MLFFFISNQPAKEVGNAHTNDSRRAGRHAQKSFRAILERPPTACQPALAKRSSSSWMASLRGPTERQRCRTNWPARSSKSPQNIFGGILCSWNVSFALSTPPRAASPRLKGSWSSLPAVTLTPRPSPGRLFLSQFLWYCSDTNI